MAQKIKTDDPPSGTVRRVTSAFLILGEDRLLEPLRKLASACHPWTPLVRDAAEGLQSVFSAVSLPFVLTHDFVQQRRFDRIHSAERIRALKEASVGDGLSETLEKNAYARAREEMRDFVSSSEGTLYIRDGIIYELDRALNSQAVDTAARELLVQTVVATWGVFESFARNFIISWINANALTAKSVSSNPGLREFIGKPVVELEIIGNHGFDLTKSMGSILFKNKRLDSLSVVRHVFETLFSSDEVRAALGADLWKLNQRRHLFVHQRGIVDEEYLQRTSDTAPVGQRLPLGSDDVEESLLSVQKAIVAIATAAEQSAHGSSRE